MTAPVVLPPGLADDVYGPGGITPDFVTVSKPAAGANASYSFSRDFAVRFLAARATLTTDANAANRIMSLDLLPGGAYTALRNLPAVAITANTTGQTFEWGSQYGQWDVNANTPCVVPLNDSWLPCPLVAQFTVDNKQAGDQLEGLVLVVQRFNP